jgi:hypothetical protein
MEEPMIVPVDYKKFQAKLNAYCPDKPFTESEAIEAFHNLVGFVTVLMQIEEQNKFLGPHHADK